jgi:hypothetical protein
MSETSFSSPAYTFTVALLGNEKAAPVGKNHRRVLLYMRIPIEMFMLLK